MYPRLCFGGKLHNMQKMPLVKLDLFIRYLYGVERGKLDVHDQTLEVKFLTSCSIAHIALPGEVLITEQGPSFLFLIIIITVKFHLLVQALSICTCTELIHSLTIQILMRELDPDFMALFSSVAYDSSEDLIRDTGIDKLVEGFIIDAKIFEPCGFSLNAINKVRKLIIKKIF